MNYMYPLQEIFSGRERAARHRKRSAVAAGTGRSTGLISPVIVINILYVHEIAAGLGQPSSRKKPALRAAGPWGGARSGQGAVGAGRGRLPRTVAMSWLFGESQTAVESLIGDIEGSGHYGCLVEIKQLHKLCGHDPGLHGECGRRGMH
eukprot:COSAG01_NODE_22080_length_872_cov_2.267788_1_plen_148_part_10